MDKQKKYARERKYLVNGTHRIAIDYPNREYDRIKAQADAEGIPVNTWVRKVLNERLDALEEQEDS